jgi:hypothetical protein
VAAHHLTDRGEVRRAALRGDDDLADLPEVGGSEEAGRRDREEPQVRRAAVRESVDRSAGDVK